MQKLPDCKVREFRRRHAVRAGCLWDMAGGLFAPNGLHIRSTAPMRRRREPSGQTSKEPQLRPGFMAPEPDADIAYDAAGGSGDRPATPLSRTGSLSRRIG